MIRAGGAAPAAQRAPALAHCRRRGRPRRAGARWPLLQTQAVPGPVTALRTQHRASAGLWKNDAHSKELCCTSGHVAHSPVASSQADKPVLSGQGCLQAHAGAWFCVLTSKGQHLSRVHWRGPGVRTGGPRRSCGARTTADATSGSATTARARLPAPSIHPAPHRSAPSVHAQPQCQPLCMRCLQIGLA